MTFCEVEKILEANNWSLDSYFDNSYLYEHPTCKSGVPKIIVVPDYDEKELPISTIRRLKNATGLPFRG